MKEPPYADIVEARKVQQQLRAIFQSHEGGRTDPAALLRVRALCALASRTIDDSYLKAKMGQVENYADALFSEAKHQQWARAPLSGAAYLRRRVFVVLDAFDTRLQNMMAVRQAASGAAAEPRR